MSDMFVISGHITMTSQMLEHAQQVHDAYRELEWIARHYDEATPEQRARWDAFLAAVEREDW